MINWPLFLNVLLSVIFICGTSYLTYLFIKKRKVYNIISQLNDKKLFLIIVLAVFLRLLFIVPGPSYFEGDGVDILNMALEKVDVDHDIYKSSPWPTLIYCFLHSFLSLNLMWSIYINLFLSILSLLVIYLLVKLLFEDKNIALISVLFLAINHHHIFFSTDNYVNMIPFFFLIFSMFLLTLSIKKENIDFTLASSFFFILTIFSRSEFVIFSVFFIFLLLLIFKPKFLLSKKSIFPLILTIFGIVILFLFLYFNPYNLKILEHGYFFYNITLVKHNLLFFEALSPFNNLLILFILTIGFYYGLKNYKISSLFSLFSILFVHMFFIFWPDYAPRHTLIQITFLSIFLANGLLYFIGQKNYIKYIGYALLIAAIIIFSFHIIDLKQRFYASPRSFEKYNKEIFSELTLLTDLCSLGNSTVIVEEKNMYKTECDETVFLAPDDMFFDNYSKKFEKYYYIYDSHGYRRTSNGVLYRHLRLRSIINMHKVYTVLDKDGNKAVLYKIN